MKWEYKTLFCLPKFAWSLEGKFREIAVDMNKLGQDGWELVAFLPSDIGLAVFKRPLGAE